MPPPIQADSLDPIIHLADNPPRHLDPNASAMSSLILYIVRVPGTQDLFLTTMHPLHSTVTAEDINACLYYIHIEPHSTTAALPSPAPTTASSSSSSTTTSRFRWSTRSTRHATPTMAIVRRNPATGAQWNVARVSATAPDSVLLEITAPGYQRFAQEGFLREMRMEGGGLWERITHRRSRSAGGGAGGEGDTGKKRKKGFMFDGLWGGDEVGRCGFKDEGAGKYLKCKYYPPSQQKSTLLSVIEFKPPSTTVMSPGPGRQAPDVITSSKSKLGMLVCHSEGLYMLDLLVAANMAVFWRRWEDWAVDRLAVGAF